jgi:hypothetical protein
MLNVISALINNIRANAGLSPIYNLSRRASLPWIKMNMTSLITSVWTVNLSVTGLARLA